MGRDTTIPSRRRTSGSGVAPTTVHCSVRRKYRYGLGFTSRSTRYTSEGIGTEIEVEALRQDHLEDVPGPDELLGAEHGVLEHLRGHVGGHLGHHVVGTRCLEWRPSQGTSQVGGELVETRPSRVERGRGLGVAPALPDHHVVHQDDALAPMVEGTQLPDDVQDGIGETGVVTGHVRQVLDFAHDVVAEIAHEPAVQWGEVVEER